MQKNIERLIKQNHSALDSIRQGVSLIFRGIRNISFRHRENPTKRVENIRVLTEKITFNSEYRDGDTLFSDVFSIDAPSGEFLGKCGINFSEHPDKTHASMNEPPTVFSFWLFDKENIRTEELLILPSRDLSERELAEVAANRDLKKMKLENRATESVESGRLKASITITNVSYTNEGKVNSFNYEIVVEDTFK